MKFANHDAQSLQDQSTISVKYIHQLARKIAMNVLKLPPIPKPDMNITVAKLCLDLEIPSMFAVVISYHLFCVLFTCSWLLPNVSLRSPITAVRVPVISRDEYEVTQNLTSVLQQNFAEIKLHISRRFD